MKQGGLRPSRNCEDSMRKIVAQVTFGLSTYTILRDTGKMQEYAVFRFDRILKKFDTFADALDFVTYLVKLGGQQDE